jgi:hypothetical protein
MAPLNDIDLMALIDFGWRNASALRQQHCFERGSEPQR